MPEIELERRVLTNHLADAAEAVPDRRFLEFSGRSSSFGEFETATNRAANTLSGLGLEKSGRLGIFARNSYEFTLAWFSAAKLGAFYVPINTEYKGTILSYQLADAEVTHLLIDPEFLDRLNAVIEELPLLKHVILSAPADVPARVRKQCNILVAADLLEGAAAHPSVPLSFDHPLAISFTSGTTGPSKGVLATNGHVIAFALDWSRLLKYRENETIYTPLPLFHAIGAWLGVVPSLLFRNPIVVSQRFSASAYWDEARAANADIVHGIFSMIPILLKQPKRDDDGTQPARAYYIGNANPEFEKRFNIQIIEAYGATETGIVAGTPYGEPRNGASCGKINTDTFDARVVDELDRTVPYGTSGELVVRPRQPFSMFSGYHAKEKVTVEAWRNLWFHTGDYCRMDEDGSLYFVDRKKDVIRRRGENISSFELEYAINQHPDILECAAVPVVSDMGEDDVKVVVTPIPGKTITAENFWEFCVAELPRFWVPTFLEIRDAMPKTATQKIQKYQLKEISTDCETYKRDWKTGEISIVPAREKS